MQILLIFHSKLTTKENFLRILISIAGIMTVFMILTKLSSNLSLVVFFILDICFLFFFFPQFTFVSLLELHNNSIIKKKFYLNSVVNKILFFKQTSNKVSLKSLEKLEIIHLGFVSKSGLIRFKFLNKKNLSFKFTFSYLTTNQLKRSEEFTGIKLINIDIIPNLAVLANIFGYDYDSTEFISNRYNWQAYLFILIILSLLLTYVISLGSI